MGKGWARTSCQADHARLGHVLDDVLQGARMTGAGNRREVVGEIDRGGEGGRDWNGHVEGLLLTAA